MGPSAVAATASISGPYVDQWIWNTLDDEDSMGPMAFMYDIGLVEEIRLTSGHVVYPIIYRVLYIPGG